MKIGDITFGMPRSKAAAQNPAGAAAERQPATLPSSLSTAGNAMPCSSSMSGLSGRWAGFEALFCSIADENQDNIALSGGGKSLGFRELKDFSARIAAFVQAKNYGPEAAVGVLCKRGAMYLAAAIGIMRAGAVYVPVERELPRLRQEAMLRPVRLLVTDSASLPQAEYHRYRNPNIAHVLCLDAPNFTDVLESGGLSSTEYWEHLAEQGSDHGWLDDVDAHPLDLSQLERMAGSVLQKTGLAPNRAPGSIPKSAQSSGKSVLDVGSGSGVVAQALASAASRYAAVDIARNELDRVQALPCGASVTIHRMEAIDICFFDERFDLVVLNGVVDCFPGYNYLRRVLDHAVERLTAGGSIFVGAVRDMDRKDDLRAAIREHALATGDQSALLRFEGSAELFVPRRFFSAWSAECPYPVEVKFSPAAAPAPSDNGQSDVFRYDVQICRSAHDARPHGTRAMRESFGLRDMDACPVAPLAAVRPDAAAYIVYTSGSTGQPKGVVVEHRHLLHIIHALREFSEGCGTVGLVAPLSFDASIQQLAVSLFCGKPLYVMADEERKNPAAFCACARKKGIDLCDMTPAFFNVLVDYLQEHRQPLPLKRVLLAGEVLRPDVIQKFYAIPGNEDVVLFNVYGPTECTVDSSAFRIDRTNHADFTAFPIGRPLEGVNIFVLDKHQRPVPDSVTGELWIAGAGVSRGYLNGESADAFTEYAGRRCYRTGDNGFIQNGLVYYRGREDQQVKIRGNRVEIGEVEKAVGSFPGVRQLAVAADFYQAGNDKSLAAYVVGAVNPADLRSYLEQQLPPFCVPDYIVPMAELPLSPNRKVDKRALPSPLGRAEAVAGRCPQGAVEQTLAAIWKRLLGMDVINAEASFFSMGGHSIMAVRLVAMIEKELRVHIAVNELMAHSSIARLAELVEGKAGVRNSPIIKLCHCEGGKNLFLFHPVGGSVFCYSDLARLLGGRYTLYAVEPAGFQAEKTVLNTELHSVQDLAAIYLDEILKVATENIVFGGWSFGGLLAYEAACQYAALGGDSGPVLILDTVLDNTRDKQLAAKGDVELLKNHLHEALAFDVDKLRAMNRAERMTYLLECGEKAGLLPPNFSPAQMENLLQTYRLNTIAAARYDNPTPSDLRILYIRALDFASNPYIDFNDQYQGWSRFLPEKNITLRWTAGTHQSMLSPGLADGVAEHICDFLGQQGEDVPTEEDECGMSMG
ncbi:alpha/beta fold hydrolase [uncultured Desulfovibrio sp.]|uniref:alpha/beta fold hydrolase n=1 Tax=uncultured Desulfovibrio sp. TaxID=167968 RepID=UPI00260C8BF9|nr:alpha/beta fold hydrolase [uncultured Desulfovibrio sp.]